VKRKGVFVIFRTLVGSKGQYIVKTSKKDDHKTNYSLWEALVGRRRRRTLKGNLVKSLLLRFNVSIGKFQSLYKAIIIENK